MNGIAVHSMLDILAFGMNEQSSGLLLTSGWVGPDHELSSYGEGINKLSALWSRKMKEKEDFLKKRLRRRLIVRKLKKQEEGDKEMSAAIFDLNIPRCLFLAKYQSSSIDYETSPDGFTPLIAAAEENVIGADHCFLEHESDGRKCLAVEYLLDREEHRPAINYESETGLTALNHACSLNRRMYVPCYLICS